MIDPLGIKAPTVPEILREMAATFEQRNKIYGDNYKLVGPVMAALFPKGVQLSTPDDYNRWHIFELIIVKITRLAQSELRHTDSIHDVAVYAAMLEKIIAEGMSNGHAR